MFGLTFDNQHFDCPVFEYRLLLDINYNNYIHLSIFNNVEFIFLYGFFLVLKSSVKVHPDYPNDPKESIEFDLKNITLIDNCSNR